MRHDENLDPDAARILWAVCAAFAVWALGELLWALTR